MMQLQSLSMCGRFFFLSAGPAVADLFQLAGVPELAPRFNIAPTQPVLAVGLDKAGQRNVATFRWGLVPRWAADVKLAPINARVETAADKPMFAEALRQRRCLIPADGYYEWQRQGKAKQPFCFRPHDDRPFAFAGIWEAWCPESGPPLLTCAILTTAANDLVRPVHDRMPLILDPRHYDLWIDRNVQEPAVLTDALRPVPADALHAYSVSPWVNDARHDDARCLEPTA
ncbi:MAG TPA: SOS response-associated peptidase [Gemmataceae bacterium]|nr:SOS response-associated peptidase [Gemmataceae bacterium]